MLSKVPHESIRGKQETRNKSGQPIRAKYMKHALGIKIAAS